MTQRRHRIVRNGTKNLRGNSKSVVSRPSDETINPAKNTNEKQHIWHSISGGLFTYIHDLEKGDRTMGIRPFSWGRFGTVPDAPEIECEGFGSNICEHCADYEECKKEYDEYIAENGENE